MTLLPTCWPENWCEIQNLSGVLLGTRDFCEIFARNNTSSRNTDLRLLRCGACCKTHLLTHLHECLLLHPASVVGLCLIYKLWELTGQWFQAKLSPSSHWKCTEFRAETPPPPHAFGIPNYVTPPCFWNSSKRNPPSLLEFQDAARGMVWIFSGITQLCLINGLM